LLSCKARGQEFLDWSRKKQYCSLDILLEYYLNR